MKAPPRKLRTIGDVEYVKEFGRWIRRQHLTKTHTVAVRLTPWEVSVVFAAIWEDEAIRIWDEGAWDWIVEHRRCQDLRDGRRAEKRGKPGEVGLIDKDGWEDDSGTGVEETMATRIDCSTVPG